MTLLMSSSILWLSVSGIQHYFAHRQRYLYMQQLYHDLKWARMEAIALNIPVAIQAYDAQKNSVTSDWCRGWVIFKNPNKTSVVATASMLKINPGRTDCMLIFSTTVHAVYFQFLPQSQIDYQDGSFVFYEHAVATMKIVINQRGRAYWVWL